MEVLACHCSGLPAHDHYMGFHCVNGIWQAKYDPDDVGRIWIDYKRLARALAGLPAVSPHENGGDYASKLGD